MTDVMCDSSRVGETEAERPTEEQPQAPLGRVLGVARPAGGRLTLTTLLGAGAAGSAIALLATSAWLISRAAQHPSVVALGVAIVGVQFFSLSRALFRYKERLVGHDATLRVMADIRAGSTSIWRSWRPPGCRPSGSGDLLARLVGDVDALSDLMLKVVPPFGVALVVGVPTVGFVWYFLRPQAWCWPRPFWSSVLPWSQGLLLCSPVVENPGKRRPAVS